MVKREGLVSISQMLAWTLLQVTSSKRKEKFKSFEVKKTPLLSATVKATAGYLEPKHLDSPQEFRKGGGQAFPSVFGGIPKPERYSVDNLIKAFCHRYNVWGSLTNLDPHDDWIQDECFLLIWEITFKTERDWRDCRFMCSLSPLLELGAKCSEIVHAKAD